MCFDNSFDSEAKLLFFQVTIEDQFGSADVVPYEKLGGAGLSTDLVKEFQLTIENFRVITK